jgi:hypothetical protein
MSRFTCGARYAEHAMYNGESHEVIKDEFGKSLYEDERASLGCDLKRKIDQPGMSGTLAVKDLCGNSHHLVSRSSIPGERHAEERLLIAVGQDFKQKNKMLAAAKVVIAMEASPCRTCTPNLLSWCQDCADRIAPGNSNSVYFVLNFHHIYQRSGTGRADDMWSNPGEAWDEYKYWMWKSPLTDPIDSPKGGRRRYQFLNFRQFPRPGDSLSRLTSFPAR